MSHLIPLYPEVGKPRALPGTYLAHEIHRLGRAGQPFVYGNFVSSLDGRIALQDATSGLSYLPGILTSTNDFRLFLELHAQADCLVTHGGYLRALDAGRLNNILQAGAHRQHPDLAEWRQTQGLSRQPAVIIVSASLDFPVPESITEHRQACYVVTVAGADASRIRALEQQGIQVLILGEKRNVEARPLIQALSDLGYRRIYLIAGPAILETMLRDRQLSRLYMTMTHQMLGGQGFHSLIPGPELGPAGYLKLQSLYYDPESPEDAGQFFMQFDCPACD